MTVHCGVMLEHLHLTIESRDRNRQSRRFADRQVDDDARKQNPLYQAFDDLCDIMREYDVTWSLGDGLASRIDRRCQRRRAVRRTGCAGRIDQARSGKRHASHGRRSGTHSDGPDRDEHREADRGLQRRSVLRARSAGHRHRSRLRPHHQRHRRGDGRLARRGDALLRHAQRTSRACPTRKTSSRA